MAFRKVSLVATEVEEIDFFVNSKLKLLKSFVCNRMGRNLDIQLRQIQ